MTSLPPVGKEKVGQAQPCVMRVVRVSGTIRKAEEECVRRARGAILRAKEGEGGIEDILGVAEVGVGEGREGMVGEVVMGSGDEESGDEDEAMGEAG